LWILFTQLTILSNGVIGTILVAQGQVKDAFPATQLYLVSVLSSPVFSVKLMDGVGS
jgi:hypothetical protein